VKPTDSVILARFVKALCPQQAIDSYTPDAWYEVIGHLGLAECRQAAAAVARRKPFVSPSEIIREIADSRSGPEPHSVACRRKDCGECRVSWCGCPCHPAVIRALTPVRGPVRRGGVPRRITAGDLVRDDESR
jgi:hypothetical protein